MATATNILIFIATVSILFKVTYSFGEPIECNNSNTFWSCGGACQDSCRRRYTTKNPCPIVNIVCNNVCYCLPGYVRDDRNAPGDLVDGENNGECIPEWACNTKPKCSGTNEEFRSHGSPCDTTCAMLGQPCPIVNKRAQPGCYCKSGFARDEFGSCIKKANCPAGRCFQLNEVYTSRPCDKMCGMLEGCASGATVDVEGCFCRTGYVRFVGGRGEASECIPEWQCYQKKYE